jgi:hypothetical protein
VGQGVIAPLKNESFFSKVHVGEFGQMPGRLLSKSSMSTLADTAKKAFYHDGSIIVEMHGGVEVKFPVKESPLLSAGTPDQLNRIEISPFGLHLPDLDEDLSFEGILHGNFGQFVKR